ncbi:Lipid A export ATP-binding/permease protein MsbA [uncultured Pleomorphomonas sp.]|uniref:Lipid A export ATP-binding/permease protein MsbA n=1 Tax=uncultured Pleomorphomonas sp. TaxID=442121 RepID=A0A212LF39_9HYPH|nr:ABC transporter ATP-binding protein [uncultured Pleomorphomonas sp.]SCM76196.1 Lipid A export ATP-binding/permease protein MsbA [uncultured Pleomorphomonas sp.]
MTAVDPLVPAGEAAGADIHSDLASLRRVWRLAGSRRGRVARGVAFRFLQSLSLGLAFGGVVWMLTGLAGGRAMDVRWAGELTALMTASLAGQVLFGYLAARDSWLASFALAGDLRLSILDHLRRLPMGFHLSRHRGDTVTALTSDMQMLESFLSDALGRIAQAFGLPVVAVAFFLVRDWAVGLALLAPMAAALPVFMWSSRRLARLGIVRQDLQAAAGARMIEFVQGIATVRAFNRMAKGEESFRAAVEAFRALSIQMVARLSTPMALFGATLMAGVPVVMLVTGLRYQAGSIDTATCVAALVLVFAAYAPLLGLAQVMELVRMADASLTRMDRILTAKPLPTPAVPAEPRGFALRFEAVDFAYRAGQPVLSGVDFAAPERTMTAIVGPSGSGKSTMLSLIARFWDVGAGAVRIGGVDVRDLSEERLASLITVVFQDVYLFAGTLFDNIAFGRAGASRADVEAAARAAQAHDFIAALPDGYDTRVGEGGATLSGGERQRVSIARAILKDAPIVLLDEATAAIDPSNELAIQKALASLVADKTLVVVAHRLSTIRAADQILVLDGGRIVERGGHTDLLADNGLYRRLWDGRSRAAGWRIR